jgi:hypothetical protein
MTATTRTTIRSTTTAALAMFSLLMLIPLAPSPALADDDEIICWEYPLNGDWETECDTRGNYKAECALTDPETTTEFCKDINSERPVRDGAPLGLSTGIDAGPGPGGALPGMLKR